VRRILDDPLLAERLGTSAARRARGYTWRRAAARLSVIHDELLTGRLVEC